MTLGNTRGRHRRAVAVREDSYKEEPWPQKRKCSPRRRQPGRSFPLSTGWPCFIIPTPRRSLKELGEKKGKEVVAKAIDFYGEQVGKQVREKTLAKGLKNLLENYQEDLPLLGWNIEKVVVDGEPRARIHACNLAKAWNDLGDPALGRLYCHMDQAKYTAYNPDLECVHVKNTLDGDPYCELAIRPKKKKAPEKAHLRRSAATSSFFWRTRSVLALLLRRTSCVPSLGSGGPLWNHRFGDSLRDRRDRCLGNIPCATVFPFYSAAQKMSMAFLLACNLL